MGGGNNTITTSYKIAGVVELVDTLVLGTSGESRGSSSLPLGTIN
jgi:hypothetical protein